MNRSTKDDKFSLWDLFVTSLPKAPWKGFFLGLFIPLTVMQLLKYFRSPVAGVAVALTWCVLFFIIDLAITRWPNIFPLMTLFMISTQFAAGMHASYYPQSALAMSLVPGLDNGLVALVFLGSLFTNKPLILFFLGEKTLKRIPAKIRKSTYHLRAWRLITLGWGMAYIIQSIILTVLRASYSPAEALVDFLFGWPIVVALLIFSVMFPRWYWTNKMVEIEKENAERS